MPRRLMEMSLCCAVLAGSAFTPRAQAQICGLSSLNTTYGYAAQTMTRVNTSLTILAWMPTTFGGTITFDGVGGLTGMHVWKVGATAASFTTYTGTYTVGTDCIGTFTYTDANNTTVSGILGAVPGGTQVSVVQTNGNADLNFQGRALTTSTCADSTLNGTFGFAANGFIKTGPSLTILGLVPLTIAGLWTFDGAGNVSAGTASVSIAGAATSRTFTGRYFVNSHCGAFVTFTDSTGQSFTFVGVLDNSGRDLELVDKDDPVVLALASRQQ
jgi:hypothetical protein